MHHRVRIDDAHQRAAVFERLDDHVAGQHQAGVRAVRQRLVGQGRVAGPENGVFPEVDVEFLFKGVVHVDPRQDAETLYLERVDDAVQGLGVGCVQGHFESHFRHGVFLVFH